MNIKQFLRFQLQELILYYKKKQIIKMMSSSTYKQNIAPPIRQGQFYRVNLLCNIDDGPFLKKDIMPNNKRSIRLLTGQGILQGIPHFNKQMATIQTKTREISLFYPQNVNNLQNSYKYCEQQVKAIKSQSMLLEREQKRLKSQMNTLFQVQKQVQKQLYFQCLPLLKKLSKTIRDQRTKQKDSYHLVSKILNQIQVSKQILVDGMLLCQNNIMKLERIVGYKTHDQAMEPIEETTEEVNNQDAHSVDSQE